MALGKITALMQTRFMMATEEESRYLVERCKMVIVLFWDDCGIRSFLKESVTVFRVHAIVQLVMIAATPIPTTHGQLCLAIDKIFLLTLTTRKTYS